MSFINSKNLFDFFVSKGAVKQFYKMLAENDNSKQQIYLGSSFSVLHQLPFGNITEFPDNQVPNFKADIELYWINDQGETERALGAQLILYPKYPEVRLSGFLKGCRTAPSENMKPVPKEQRITNNAKDGRILFFAVTNDRKLYAYLAKKDSAISKEILAGLQTDDLPVLNEFIIDKNTQSAKEVLLSKLTALVKKDKIASCRMFPDGQVRPYTAVNAGGYTMEASFDIIPNGTAEPDFKGWELKAFSGSTITLMTPEPDKGLYKEIKAKEFAVTYGHKKDGYISYFTGPFRCGEYNENSGLTMILKGYDNKKKTITDPSGGIYLVDTKNNAAAVWSFSLLLKHWCKKHAHACYLKYKKEKEGDAVFYKYLSPVLLGEGTYFELFLSALYDGKIIYDPGISVKKTETGGTKVKARSQFRISVKNLAVLYESFQSADV